MARLSEAEIFSKMTESLRLAEEASRALAVHPGAGLMYDQLRNNLRLVEGCCRQIGYWRGGDARWLPMGMMMARTHSMAGNWLRGVQQADGTRRPIAAGERHPTFLKLADNLCGYMLGIEKLKNERTGRRGAILPDAAPAPHRESRPVQVRTPGGLFLPPGAMLQ